MRWYFAFVPRAITPCSCVTDTIIKCRFNGKQALGGADSGSLIDRVDAKGNTRVLHEFVKQSMWKSSI